MAGQVLWLTRLQMNPRTLEAVRTCWIGDRPAAGDQVCPSVLKQMTGHVLGCRDFRSINISGHDTLDWRPTSCWRSKSVPFSVEANGWPSSWLSRLQMNPPNIRRGRQAGNGEMRALPPVVRRHGTVSATDGASPSTAHSRRELAP